jgi:hypothetical protein
MLQPKVPFYGAHKSDPLVITRGRVANFFISSNFHLISFTHNSQYGPETESVKKKFGTPTKRPVTEHPVTKHPVTGFDSAFGNSFGTRNIFGLRQR